MKVFVLGLDGATWDVLCPLADEGHLPNISAIKRQGVSGPLQSIFPPLSPVAWTGVMTGKNSGKHGVFEFLEFNHDPLSGRVNSSRSIHAELLWEIAGRHGKRSVVGGVPMSYPHRRAPGFYLGDFLSPPATPDFASDPAVFAELERFLGQKYCAWNSTVHDGGNEDRTILELTGFLDQHLKTVRFLMERCPWDLFVFDLMATDRAQHELWHAWDPKHCQAEGRDFAKTRQSFIDFWKRLDDGIGEIQAALPGDTSFILMSDHGFGPIEWYVNFNVWLLQQGFIALEKSFYVKQKHWCHKRGITPEWFYRQSAKLGLAKNRVARFRGKQMSWIERLADSVFLSRRHIDWSETKAYAQGNFGQIFINQKGRQPRGCVAAEDAPFVIEEIKGKVREIKNPETGEPLVDRIYERDEIYDGPFAHLAPDLTVVPADWRYRTIGLYDFTTNKVITEAFGPTGDHRMEGIFIGHGPAFRSGAELQGSSLLDIAPTVLHLLGVPVPSDMDGRVLEEILDSSYLVDEADQARGEDAERRAAGSREHIAMVVPYTDEEDLAIQQRLSDLGYL
jgi:predicted AlkP superfamily phosphohydrolase/phosphomutase